MLDFSNCNREGILTKSLIQTRSEYNELQFFEIKRNTDGQVSIVMLDISSFPCMKHRQTGVNCCCAISYLWTSQSNSTLRPDS